MAMTNIDLWNKLRGAYPTFKSHTAKGTAELFTERGFETLKEQDPKAINDFFELSMRVSLLTVNISHAKDGFEDADFGEAYNVPFGAIIQKMNTTSVTPISPAYKNLKDGSSPDPFIVRKPKTAERFFKQNFDYSSFITIPDDFQKKTIFISEFGMSEYMAGIMEGLQNGYIVQKYETKLEAINAYLNSTKYPLKDTQKINVSYTDNATNEQVAELILAIMNAAQAMELPPQTDAFNSYGFKSTQDRKRLRLLVRPGIKNKIYMTLPQIFHYKESPLADIQIIEVADFGGIQTQTAEGEPLYPIYNELGERTGWTKTKGGTEAYTGATKTVDPNANIFAMLADKGLIFEGIQNAYTVEPMRNPRGLYTNYQANCPDNTVAVDPLYNAVVIGNFT